MADRRRQRRDNYYHLQGDKYLSVTTPIEAIEKPAIKFWFGHQIYLAMVDNPALDWKNAKKAPYRAKNKAMDRGTAVHRIIEFGLESDLRKIPKDLRGYVRAYRQWHRDYKPDIIEHERTVVSRKYKFAGTLDMIAQMSPDMPLIIVDAKTGKALYKEVWLQLSALRQGLREEGLLVGGVAALLLRADGSYVWEFKDIDLLDVWLAAKRIWEWQHPAR